MTLLLWGRKAAWPPPATRAVQSSRKRTALLKPCGTAALPTASEIRRWVNIHGFLIETPGDQINREVLAKQGTETNKQTSDTGKERLANRGQIKYSEGVFILRVMGSSHSHAERRPGGQSGAGRRNRSRAFNGTAWGFRLPRSSGHCGAPCCSRETISLSEFP